MPSTSTRILAVIAGFFKRLPRWRNGTFNNSALPAFELVCVTFIVWGIGCSRAPEKHVTEYKLIGEVRKLDTKSGSVTIRHEAIPGFMEAMTMPFTIKDRRLLEEMSVGDEVEGKLRVERVGKEVSDYELTDLIVSRPAPPPAIQINLAGEKPQFKVVPKELKPGDLVPDFTMKTQEGKSLRLSDLRGNVVALTFIYTRCPLPNFCPLMDKKFAELANRIAASPRRAEHIRLLSISFDPDHDTPEVLRKHAESRAAHAPLWTFAVASHDELFKVAHPLGLSYGPYKDEIIHNLSVAVIDPDGKLARLESGQAAGKWEPIDLLKTMYSRLPQRDN